MNGESGLGTHEHDVESVEMRVAVWRRRECTSCPFGLIVAKATGKAHGLGWYDNTLEIDEFTRFPLTVLVEEGKHASCPDKNGDGYFTPNYDVTENINDAWGVHDTIRGGTLFTPPYQAWMTKIRRAEHRVFPPGGADPIDGVGRNPDTSPRAVYTLRPFPSAEKAEPDLVPFIAGRGDPDWPEVVPGTSVQSTLNRLREEPLLNPSFAVESRCPERSRGGQQYA